jgi:hypothetical protein
LTYTTQVYRYLKTSLRDLYPRFGWLAQIGLQHDPWIGKEYGYRYLLYGRVYLPGIGRHHSLRLSTAWQQQVNENSVFRTALINFPRGYENNWTEELIISTIDYSMPLLYPDLSVGPLVYFKRIQANFFCDIGQNRYRTSGSRETDALRSGGIDLLADVNFLRFEFPFTIGIRTTYVPERKQLYPSLLFSVNFY